MLDGVTLDQLRTFIAAVEQGSFSAAGRKLRRRVRDAYARLANTASTSMSKPGRFDCVSVRAGYGSTTYAL